MTAYKSLHLVLVEQRPSKLGRGKKAKKATGMVGCLSFAYFTFYFIHNQFKL